MSASMTGSEMPARFCEPFIAAACEEKKLRNESPGVPENPNRCTVRSKSKSSTRLRYCTGSTTRRVASMPSGKAEPGRDLDRAVHHARAGSLQGLLAGLRGLPGARQKKRMSDKLTPTVSRRRWRLAGAVAVQQVLPGQSLARARVGGFLMSPALPISDD